MYRTKEEAVAAASSRFTPIFTNTFESEPPAGDPPAGDPPAGDPPAGDPPAGDPPVRQFTQEQVNSMMAREKKKDSDAAKQANSDLLNQLNMLKTKDNMTEEERTGLETQIEELNKRVFSAEELATRDKKKLETQYTQEKEELTGQRDYWQNEFTEATLSRSITDAAVANEAWNPTQIVSIISPQTRLVEDKDDNGKVTGYTPMASVKSKDDKDKDVTIDVTVPKAIEMMKENPSYYNLFKGKSLDGLNSDNGGGGGSADPSKMTMEQYKAHREKEIKAGRQ